MRAILESFEHLKNSGQLHKKLIFRTQLLTGIGFILIGVVVYETVRYQINIWVSLSVGIIAFILGVYIFSKMSSIVWNEEAASISTGRMDIFGAGVLVLYIVFEITLRTTLQTHFGDTSEATGYLFAGIGASLLGRSVGTLIAIRSFAGEKGIDDTQK